MIEATETIGMDIRSPREGEHPDHLAAVDHADLIFFTGGDQVRLVKRLGGSTVLERIRARFAAGATLAGTSAGAAAASDPMIFDGDGRGLLGRAHLGNGETAGIITIGDAFHFSYKIDLGIT